MWRKSRVEGTASWGSSLERHSMVRRERRSIPSNSRAAPLHPLTVRQRREGASGAGRVCGSAHPRSCRSAGARGW